MLKNLDIILCIQNNLIFKIFIFFIYLSMSGCGLHFHNAGNEELARKANDAFNKADIGKYIDAERAVLKQTNERDLLAMRRNILAERDRSIITALDKDETIEGYLKLISDRLDNIGFPKNESEIKIIKELPDKFYTAIQFRDFYLVSVSNQKISRVAFPPNNEDEKLAKKIGGNPEYLFRQYQEKSKEYSDSFEKLKKFKGSIGEINTKLIDTAKFQVEITAKLNEAKKDLKNATTEYNEALNYGKTTWDELVNYRNTIESSVKKFDSVVDLLEKQARELGMNDLLAEIRLERIKVMRDQLGEFLTAFSDEQLGNQKTDSAPLITSSTPATSGTPAEASHAINQSNDAENAGKIATVLMGMSKEIHDSTSEAKLVPLTFQKEKLRLEFERMNRMLDRGKQRISLLQSERNVFIAEGKKLWKANNLLNNVSNGNNKVKLGELLKSNNKDKLLQAIYLRTESISVEKRQEEEKELAMISLDHEEALDSTEFALGLWKEMISSPLEQLVNYHASGITSDDISKLLQAASLAGIAVGVNR